MSESAVRPCADGTPPPDVESSHGWLLSVWLLVAAFLALALVESARVGIPVRDPGGAVFLSRIAISAGIFVPLAILDAWCRTDRGCRDRRTVLVTLRRRWPRRRLALAASGLLAYYVVYFSYHNLKSWDVLNSPRDTMLLAWDRWLFLGHSPAGLLHDLLGTHVAAYVLMVVYESFSTLVTVAVVASMVLPTRIREGYVFIASSLWVWILGVGSYYLIPSLGPHPDHVQVHRVGSRAADLAGTPVVLEATFPAGVFRALLRFLRFVGHPLGRSAPLGVDRVFSARSEITHRVRVGRHLHAKRAAMAAHGTQRRADGQVRVLDRIVRLPSPLFALAFGSEWYVEQHGRAGARHDDVFATLPPR